MAPGPIFAVLAMDAYSLARRPRSDALPDDLLGRRVVAPRTARGGTVLKSITYGRLHNEPEALTMRTKWSIVVVGVVVAAGLPAPAAAFPGQGSCAGEGAFVSGTAQSLGSGFGTFVAATAQNGSGLAEVIAASHAANCEPRP
jgi:hypothetical protein